MLPLFSIHESGIQLLDCKCSLSCSRWISSFFLHVLGPSVIIISVNDHSSTSFVSRKPPCTFSLSKIMNELSVVPPSLATFDIVGFVSVMPTNTDDKPVLATKIRQRWRKSSSQKLLEDDEQLCQMFARSRVIVLERFHDRHISFLCDITQCCSVTNIKSAGTTDGCKTLREAVKQIAKDSNLENLRSTICASFPNHYQCPYCLSIADSMICMTNAVPLYQ